MGKILHLKGPGLNSFIAVDLVRIYGAQGARERCTGEMLAAVEKAIAEQAPKAVEASGLRATCAIVDDPARTN